MKVGGVYYRSIWPDENDPGVIHVIDQRLLPFSFEVVSLTSVADVYEAIRDMTVRGAPLIGATAAWGVYLSFLKHAAAGGEGAGGRTVAADRLISAVVSDAEWLKSARPTAVNLAWAADQMTAIARSTPDTGLLHRAASQLCDEEAERSRSIGLHGLPLIEALSQKKGGAAVNILTHCNAGWLACVDWGTALAPVYLAHDKGVKVHVWVDETRPRNQGSRLTAWELLNHGVPSTLITDNAGGHLMQKGMVDLVLTGCDRATASGDVANKTGTYLKALAAHDNGIPFYAALPVSTFDLTIDHPDQIEIEERDAGEVTFIEGIRIAPEGVAVSNYGFDVTPAQLITGLITDRGVCRAEKSSILKTVS